uniref:DNA-directed RNA polymerase subunit beta n=1 Tax=Marsupiomonas sp. NIES 1824 TaxID=1562198 RepID=A0A097KLX7_9CHLO|nr:beta subunit of RNA polymerase [Marsupiomonas sp. NIES 1824]
MGKKKKIAVADFITIQRQNFQHFLNVGMVSEIELRNSISHAGVELVLYPEYSQFCRSESSMKSAIANGRTYGCRLYVPGQLIHQDSKVSKFQWILLGTVPLMNRRGHFILNGSARVIINQMVRSPGIYYAEKITRKTKKGKKKKKGKIVMIRTVYADLISQRGTWLRFETSPGGQPFVQMKRTPKIPVSLLLQAMGLSTTTITQRLSMAQGLSMREEDLMTQGLVKRHWFPDSTEMGFAQELVRDLETFYRKTGKQYRLQEWALISLYALTHPKCELMEITPEMGKRFLFRKFLNPKTYDLGLLGRSRLNQRFNLGISTNTRILTAEDILKITEHLGEVFHRTAVPDDIDHLKNRRIRSSAELIQNQFALGLTRFEKVIHERLTRANSGITLSNLVTTKPINAAFREFFGSSQLSQFLDQTNPLAEITHKRRFTSLGPSGVSRETAGMAIRGIHPTHYGRICPIETPEGKNAGLVNSPTMFTRISQDGFLQSPFQKVFKGQAQPEIFYLTADQEEKFMVAPGDLNLDKLRFLEQKFFPARCDQDFLNIKSNSIHFLSLSSFQMISIATSLIPFFEHDDANRALMGSNMQRQAVPLLNPEKPIVGTGYESRVVSDSGHSINARFSGYVTFVSCEEIQVYSLIPATKKSPFPFFEGSEPNHNFKNSLKNPSHGWKYELKTITYPLESVSRSNQDTYQFERPLVQEGQWIQKGEALADGSASADGSLALGKNILIGYLPWEGYNFEDAILISERLVKQDLYTSLHVEKYDMDFKDTRFGKEQLTPSIPDLPKRNQKLLDERGIIKLGSWVKEGDVLVGKITPIEKKKLSPHERLLYDIVGKQVQDVKDTSLRVPKGLVARVVKIRLFDEDGRCYETSIKGKATSTRILDPNKKSQMAQLAEIGKFIIQKKRRKTQQHPHFPNSFYFLFKMRKRQMGQPNATSSNLKKAILEQEGRESGIGQKKREKDFPLLGRKTIQRVQLLLAEKRRIQVGDKMAGRHGNKGIVSRIVPKHDMPFLPDGTPLDLVLNPLGVPSRMNVGQIYECLLGFAGSCLHEHYQIMPFDEMVGAQTSRSIVYSKLLKARKRTGKKWLFNPNFPGKVKLFDGRTGEPFDQHVTVGQSYILKLVHQVDEKIHARSTGPYSLVTQQPLRGRSKHGGQRVGEMEVWALEGFGAAFTLQELLTVKSDDMKGRYQVMDAILTDKPMQLGTPESFKVLIRELQSLCLDIGVFVLTTKEVKPIDPMKGVTGKPIESVKW